MDNNNVTNRDEVFSKRIKAGKRTYFFDVKATRGNDYYITITESKRKSDGYGYDKHKIFLYKEDFHKFVSGLNDVVDHIKNELMPGYDFTKHAHDGDNETDDSADFSSGFEEISHYSSLNNLNGKSNSGS